VYWTIVRTVCDTNPSSSRRFSGPLLDLGGAAIGAKSIPLYIFIVVLVSQCATRAEGRTGSAPCRGGATPMTNSQKVPFAENKEGTTASLRKQDAR
jgi:hypothetical protein